MSLPSSRRTKVASAFDEVARLERGYQQAFLGLPKFVRNFEEKHSTLFWGIVILTPVLFSGLKQLHKTIVAEAEERRRKES